MSEEADYGVGSVGVEDECRNVIEIQEQGGPVLNHSAVLMTGDELPGGFKQVSEVRENNTVPMEDPISSPLGSFQSV